MGFTLSKPYRLRIFDARVQSKATFNDYASVAKLLAKPSEDLLQVLSDDEVRCFLQGKAETLLLGLLTAWLSSRKGSSKLRNTASGQELSEQVEAFLTAANAQGSLLSEMADQLEIVFCVLFCTHWWP